jgi:chromosome segregation ATPase
MTEYQEFPRMMFHPILGNTIVNNNDECTAHLKKGWSKTVVPPDEESILKSRITEYESDLAQMKTNLSLLTGEPYLEGDIDAKIDSVIAENKELTGTVDSLSDKISTLEREKAELKDLKMSLSQQVEDLQGQIDRAEAAAKEAEKKSQQSGR